MAGESIKRPEPLPHFANAAEAAAFWDEHSPEDYPDEFEDVEATFDRPLIRRAVTLEFSEEMLAELRRCAASQGVEPSALVQLWVIERLQQARG